MLLEREGLLASLGEHLENAGLGDGSLVLLAGEAGAGKTTVVRAFLDSLDEHTLAIQGACDPLTTPRPLSPLHDFAADPNSGLSDITSADRESMEAFGLVLDRLRNTIRPIVMVVEDIHWADDATLDFLRFMGRRIVDSKATVICTYRDDEVDADHPLRPVLGQLIPLDSTHRYTVPLLSVDAVTALSADREIDPGDLFRLTGGNAFYVTEVLASHQGLPPTIRDAVISRLTRVDLNVRRAAEAVSIAPRFLEIEKVEALVGATTDDIDAAVGSGILLGDGVNLRFRHDLARAAVEDSIPPARRLSMHRGMIALLEEDIRRDTARLAHHAIRASNPDLIVEYAPAAADEAIRTGARREGVAFLRAALAHTNELGPEGTAHLRLKLGAELRHLDDPMSSEQELRLAIDHYRASGDVEGLADALGTLQGALWNLRRFDEGKKAMDEAISVLRPQGPSEMLGVTLYRIAHLHMLARHGKPAGDYIEEAARVATEVDSFQLDWLILMMRGCIHVVLGNADEGLRLLGECVEKAEERDDPGLVASGLSMLGSGGGEARRYDSAIPALQRGVEQGLATDEDYSVAYNRSWLARIAFEQGRWDDAVEHAGLVGKTTLQREGIAFITAMSALGRVRVRRGDPGGLPLLEEMTELAQSHELQHGWNAICGRAEYHWLTGNPETGLDLLQPAYGRALDTDSEWARGEIGFWMWRVGAIDAPPKGAAEPLAFQMAGDWSASADAWQEIGCPYEVAMALAEGPEEAKLEALEILDSLGARPMADRVRASLRHLGVERIPRGPTKETLANPAGLTSRQLEVLRLLADGLTNSQIAEELYLSKKTVEHHVSAIYTKLGVTSRTKAAREAERMGVFSG